MPTMTINEVVSGLAGDKWEMIRPSEERDRAGINKQAWLT